MTTSYNTLTSLKGKVEFELTHADDTKSKMVFTLDNQESPSTNIKMKINAFKGLVAKEENPMNLFMTGQIQLDGDMAFAMALQPLFV